MRGGVEKERGAALLLALLATIVLAVLGSGLIVLGNVETSLAQNHRTAGERRYAAEAAAERALAEVRTAASWSDLLTGLVRSSLFASSSQPMAPWGTTVDLQLLTAELQAESNAAAAWGANDPVWRIFASGAFDAAAGGAPGVPPAYLIVWVADDPMEIDGDPASDTNETILVRALAVSPSGLRAAVQLTARRVAGIVKVMAWRLVQ